MTRPFGLIASFSMKPNRSITCAIRETCASEWRSAL
jgi:hypothetical protein